MYGSSFKMRTEIPRALSSRPIDATVIPLPTDETTPPETKMYFVARAAPVWSTGFQPSTLVPGAVGHFDPTPACVGHNHRGCGQAWRLLSRVACSWAAR